jgi:hypothetical protein
MSKLTIRYFIDGAQVDEQALDEDRPEADLRALIVCSKHGISECVSEIESEFRVGPSLLGSPATDRTRHGHQTH